MTDAIRLATLDAGNKKEGRHTTRLLVREDGSDDTLTKELV